MQKQRKEQVDIIEETWDGPPSNQNHAPVNSETSQSGALVPGSG
jgi:hypothetical protein